MPRHRAGLAHVVNLLLTGDNYIRHPAGHRLLGLLLPAVYGRLAGYEDMYGAERPGRDPAMRAIVGARGAGRAGSVDQRDGPFETQRSVSDANPCSTHKSLRSLD